MPRSAATLPGSAAALARVAFTVAIAAILVPGPARAQVSALTDQCSAIPGADALQHCNLVAEAVVAVQPGIGIAAAGGNPVPGTASTVGMRVRSSPRLSLNARATGVLVETPRSLGSTDTGSRRFFAPALGLDAAMGLLEGLSLAPTVGGVLSLDALAGMALVPLPGDFRERANLSWAVGARLGLLRESFTLPGVSASLMYRHLGRVSFGDPALLSSEGFFQGRMSMVSLRGAASKRVYVVDVTVGAGVDRIYSDTRFGSAWTAVPYTFTVNGLKTDRGCAFVDVAWTSLVWQMVGELGWQGGPGTFPGLLPPGAGTPGGAPFGSFALRLTI
ncbi:MAG: hypothetical protein P8174_04150 [Gemmatimonadota bacterium]